MNSLNFAGVARVNEAHLVEMIEIDDGHVELAKEIIDLVRGQVPLRLEAIENSLELANYTALAEHVHAFKSSLHNSGARRAAAICETIEHVLYAQPIDYQSLRALVPMLSPEVAAGLAAAEDFIAQRRSLRRVA